MVAAVIAGRGDRLGARLRNLLGAWRWARHAGAPLLLDWPDWDVIERKPYPFHDLFDRAGMRAVPDLVVVQTQPRGEPERFVADGPGWPEARAARDRWLDAARLDPAGIAGLPPDAYISYRTTGVLLLPGDGPQAAAEDLPHLFGLLPVQPAVAAAVDAALPDPADRPVALHVRRGDTIAHLFGRTGMAPDRLLQNDIDGFVARYAHLDAYLRAVDALYPQAPVSIFSDDEEARGVLAARFGARVVDVHAALDRCVGLSYAQRAFAEFLVIARSRAVIAARSQFATLPAELGGIPRHDVREYTDVAEAAAEVGGWVEASPRCPPAGRPAFLARILDAFAQCYGPRRRAQRDAFAAAAAALRPGPARPAAAGAAAAPPPQVAGVVAGRADGLGARLRNLLAAWRWARHARTPLLLRWTGAEDGPGAPGSFHELFDRARMDALDLVLMEEPRRGEASHPRWVEAEAARGCWREATAIAPADWPGLPPGTVIHYGGTGMLPLPGDGRHAARDLAALFAELPIHPAIVEAVAAAAPDPADPPMALLDHRLELFRALFGGAAASDRQVSREIETLVARYAPADAYLRAVAAFPDVPVRLFVDDPAMRAALKQRFGARVVGGGGTRTAAWRRLTPTQRALAEMLVIARSRGLVGGRSELAILPAQIGGIRQVDVRVHVRAEEAVEELRALVVASPHLAGEAKPIFLARILDRMAHGYRHLRLLPQAEAFAIEAKRLSSST